MVQVNRIMPGFQRTVREMSVLQRERGVMLDSGRGHFTDVHGRPLTGKLQWGVVLVPQPDNANEGQVKLSQLAIILHTDTAQLKEEWDKERTPHFWTGGGTEPVLLTDAQIKDVRSLNLQGADVYPVMSRYFTKPSGSQWLGYLSEQSENQGRLHRHQDEVKQPFAMKSGAAGLERTLEPLLRGVGPTLITRMVSGNGQVIPEIEPRVIAPANTHYPLVVETTIDARIQQGVEELTVASGIQEGAVVILDTANADVRAMVSLPFINRSMWILNNPFGESSHSSECTGFYFQNRNGCSCNRKSGG